MGCHYYLNVQCFSGRVFVFCFVFWGSGYMNLRYVSGRYAEKIMLGLGAMVERLLACLVSCFW